MLKAEWGVTRQRFLKYPWAGSPYSLCLSASRYIVSQGSQAVSPCSSGAISRAQNMSAAVRTLQHQPSFVFTHGRLGFCASISSLLSLVHLKTQWCYSHCRLLCLSPPCHQCDPHGHCATNGDIASTRGVSAAGRCHCRFCHIPQVRFTRGS